MANGSDSTRTPLSLSLRARATVLRCVLTTLSCVGASSSAGGDAAEAWIMGWLSAGVAGQSNATRVWRSPMGRKS